MKYLLISDCEIVMTGSLTEIIERYKGYPSPIGMRIILSEFQVEDNDSLKV